MPLVSVIIPAYNASRTIEQAVRSALEQRHRELEVLVIDDGSSDDTAERADRMGVRVIRQPNQGPGAARNQGLEAARGELIQFLDADDVLHPHKIQRCLPEPGSRTLRFCHQAFFVDGTPPLRSRELRLGGGLLRERFRFDPQRPLASALAFPIGTLRPLHRADALRQIGGFDPGLRNLEDILLNVSLVLAGHRFELVDATLVFCREHDTPGRLRHAPDALEHAARGEALILEAVRAADALDQPGVRHALASRWGSLARRQLVAGDRAAAEHSLGVLSHLRARGRLRLSGSKLYNQAATWLGIGAVAGLERTIRGYRARAT